MVILSSSLSWYTYYHCTARRGKCPEPYTREETHPVNLPAEVSTRNVLPKHGRDWRRFIRAGTHSRIAHLLLPNALSALRTRPSRSGNDVIAKLALRDRSYRQRVSPHWRRAGLTSARSKFEMRRGWYPGWVCVKRK